MLTWRKSSSSEGPDTDCVEIAHRSPSVLVRDSKNAAGPVLDIGIARWDSFVAGVRQGEI
jgi:hypothetical protein